MSDADDLVICVDKDGTLTMIYDDDLSDLLEKGPHTIQRVSHVEPDQCGYGWSATMVEDGMVLGPYWKRSQALAAEREYLEEKMFR